MYKFIFLTFAFLAWAFYEMSGGSDFEPMQPVAEAAPSVATVQTVASTDTATTARPASIEQSVSAVAEPAVEVTRAAYTAPKFDLRTPAEEELAAVDPAVLSAFSGVLGKDEDVTTPGVELAAADSGLVVDQSPLDLREVTGNRVNMRNGPGTDYSIVGRLERGDEVEVLAEPGNGWLKLRVSDSGRIGWMADFLVSSAD